VSAAKSAAFVGAGKASDEVVWTVTLLQLVHAVNNCSISVDGIQTLEGLHPLVHQYPRNLETQSALHNSPISGRLASKLSVQQAFVKPVTTLHAPFRADHGLFALAKHEVG